MAALQDLPCASEVLALSASPLSSAGANVECVVSLAHHPGIDQSWRLLQESTRLTNGLVERVGAWITADTALPPDCIEAHNSVTGELHALQKELERLDSLDLDILQPDWGDKASVRTARKALIGFAEAIMTRLDTVQAFLLPCVREHKKERQSARSQQPIAEEPENFQDKYRDLLATPIANSSGEPLAKRPRMIGTARAVLSATLGADGGRLLCTGSARDKLDDCVERLSELVKLSDELKSLSLKSFSKRLVKLAASPEMLKNDARSGEVCSEALQVAVGALSVAQLRDMDKKKASKFLGLTERLLRVRDVQEFQDVLAELSFAVKGL